MRRNQADIKHRYATDLPAFMLSGDTPPPVRLFDIEAIELIDGPPAKILSFNDFRVYQRWMSRLIVRLPAVFLAAEMGLGKTAAVL